MRSPEEGAPTGAGPGTGDRASGQRLEEENVQERPSSQRAQPVNETRDRTSSNRQHEGNAAPADDAAADRRQSLTLAGRQRQRIMWTREMNMYVIHCHYTCTRLETDMSGRPRMLDMFIERFPRFANQLDRNKLYTRQRAILSHNMLTTAELDSIKLEVQRELEGIGNGSSDTSSRSSVGLDTSFASVSEEATTPENMPMVPEQAMDQRRQQLRDELAFQMDTAVAQFRGTDPAFRHRIPKLQYSYQLTKTVSILNEDILPLYLAAAENLEELQCIVYSAAVAAVRTLGLRTYPQGSGDSGSRPKKQKPAWMRRLETRIATLRVKIGRLTQYKRGNRSRRLIRQIGEIVKPAELRDLSEANITEILDTHVQRLSALAKRMRRYGECSKRKEENRMFNINEREFYNRIRNNKSDYSGGLPEIGEVTQFWANLWEHPAQHNNEGMWLVEEEENSDGIERMAAVVVTTQDIREATRYTRNWAAPGPDFVHNFWYKKFSAIHGRMAECFNMVLRNPQQLPDFITKGVTYLLPKDHDTANPAKYRPITCLSSLYKVLSSVITRKVQEHCDAYLVMTEEQKGCRKNTQGCKDQVIIDAVIVGQASRNKRNLGMAYIDYKKAYDSVPHSYLIKVLELYKVDDGIIRLMQHAMRMWSTSLHVTDGATVLRSRTLSIRRGIFQGDTFSPLWFCLAMNPLSRALNRCSYGYQLKSGTTSTTVTHTFYMDDLKLFAESTEKLRHLLQLVTAFSNDIRMEFGIDKCRLVNIYRGKVLDADSFRVNEREEIRTMVEGESYKYLGFLQLKGIHHTAIKKELQDKFLYRVNRILKTSLNAGNKVKAINTFAVPFLTYSFGVVKWTKTDLEAIERALRVSLTKHRMHHPRSATERVTLPRIEGGRGATDIQALCVSQIQQLRRYFVESQNRHEIYRTVCEADHGFSALHLAQEDYQLNCDIKTVQEKVASWKLKELHGTHPHQLDQTHIDKVASNAWLVRGDLFPETEGFMVAIQDRVIATKNYRRYILHENVEDRCRKCNAVGETIEHIVAGCPALAEAAYLGRHNAVAKIVHQQLALKHDLVNRYVPYYKYLPDPVLENSCIKLYWDREIITDVLIRANRPDIVVYNKRMKRVTLIDIAVPLDRNVQSTYSAKITKYHDLAEELKQMWHLEEVRIVPVVISATGLVPCPLLRSLEELDLQKERSGIQKAVILGTCNIVRRFLNHHN